ncbi:MAG: response regulator transcription factor [Anaerolineales bacterium]|nr:response regulator transcription factor [Chloroflexota bacterium]MBL6983034.1 response regulator transcription factor [Anaerolineales bacterium]
MKQPPYRVLLADDHAVLRSGLIAMLAQHQDYEVVGEAASGLDTLSMAEELQPDLILLDLTMPGLSGLDALPSLRRKAPGAKILILTMHEDPHYFQQAMRAGAAGYVLKKAADSELLSAMWSVMHGERYVHPSMTHHFIEDLFPHTNKQSNANDWTNLSQRERQVLRLVALGHTGAEIAGELNLSPKTIDTYRSRGMEKLGLKTRASLVRFALQRGLLS